jgi:hypothetical protein
MARKPIPTETQKNILTKSRRRCCLCFWLEGKDEVQKGQIAHLDGNNENADEDNLAFLCFDHHDEYDGTTRLAKGLREDEVRHWRDELYREMEYRFRTFKRRALELTITGFRWCSADYDYTAEFRLKNNGDSEIRSPCVSIRLPPKVSAEEPYNHSDSGPFQLPKELRDPWGMREDRQDFFEPSGRVGVIVAVPGIRSILLPGHSTDFRGLGFRENDYPLSSEISLEYRIDAEETQPIYGKVTGTVPDDIHKFQGLQ